MKTRGEKRERKRWKGTFGGKMSQKLGRKRRQDRRCLEKRELVEKFKEQGCCMCEEKEACCLDFHHVDPKKKKTEVARLMVDARSVKALLAEMDKCILLCANCHRKLHAGKKGHIHPGLLHLLAKKTDEDQLPLFPEAQSVMG